MSPMKTLRWIIAETLVGWAFQIAPDDDGSVELGQFILAWLPRQKQRAK